MIQELCLSGKVQYEHFLGVCPRKQAWIQQIIPWRVPTSVSQRWSLLEILYHFNQLDSHKSQAPVFCLKLLLVTGHQDQCLEGPL